MQAACLYTGTNPVQTGVDIAKLDVLRAAIVRGRVLDTQGNPLPNVSMRVLDHAEFGGTASRADGYFDMAVNGGGSLVLTYALPGYVTSHRRIDVDWQAYGVLPDVRLTRRSALSTAVALDAQTGVTMQPVVAKGDITADERGSRQATLLFPAGTGAQVEVPGQPLVDLVGPIHVRLTELTVGPGGPEAMPATLPPTSAYTYAAELSIDEAEALGPFARVHFNQPVIVYVDNFLGFPTGWDVPSGYYDEQRGLWVPSESGSGRVIRVASVTNGMAELDLDGDGVTADATALAALGVTPDEQQQLASLYPPGATIWRVPLVHLTTFDFNWGQWPPSGAFFPSGAVTTDGGSVDSPSITCGSIVETENQVLRETIPLTGSPHVLTYSTDRAPGRLISIRVPLIDTTGHPELMAIAYDVSIAGRYFWASYEPTPDQVATFYWDGRDAQGRVLQGAQTATVTIIYWYKAAYGPTGSFGGPGGGLSVRAGPPMLIEMRRSYRVRLDGRWSSQPLGLGGWDLSPHHAYDVASHTLYMGDGTRRRAEPTSKIVSVAGNGSAGPLLPAADDVAATMTRMDPARVAAAADGSVYVAEGWRVSRVDPTTGKMHRFAGSQPGAQAGDYATWTGSEIARNVQLGGIADVAVGPNGDVYLLDALARRVSRVDASGGIHLVAGNGQTGHPSTSTPYQPTSASTQPLMTPEALAVGPDGSVYVGDTLAVYRIDPAGAIWLFAGDPAAAPCPGGAVGNLLSHCGDGGLATSALLQRVHGLAAAADGTVYLSHGVDVVRAIGADGVIRHVAGQNGDGWATSSEEGVPAHTAGLKQPKGLAVGSDGSLYIADEGNNLVRRVRPPVAAAYGEDGELPNGIIETVAGRVGQPLLTDCAFGNTPTATYPGVLCAPFGTARSAYLGLASGVAVAPGGAIFIADGTLRRVLHVKPSLPGLELTHQVIPSADGAEVYVFDGAGRHLETRDALTNQVLLSFANDPTTGVLEGVTDAFGRTTALAYTGGELSAITTPNGQVTTFGAFDADGYMTSVTNPAGEQYTMTYVPPSSGGLGSAPTGLLETFQEPGGAWTSFAYDPTGRLIRETDANSAEKVLDASTADEVKTVVLHDWGSATEPGTSEASAVEVTAAGVHRTITAPDFTVTESLSSAEGVSTLALSDGTLLSSSPSPDPRFGALARYAKQVTLSTGVPGALKTMTTARAKSVELADPNDPLSVVSADEQTTVNGAVWSEHYDAVSRTLTTTTPMGFVASTTFDALGRVVSAASPGLEPTTVVYDGSFPDRVLSVTVGATSPRTQTFSYFGAGPSAGLASSASLPNDAAHGTGFTYDLAHRPTSMTAPDGATVVGMGWNEDGRLTSWTTPNLDVHTQAYDLIGQLAHHASPPALGAPAPVTVYEYRADRQVDRITRPDGHVIAFQYDPVTAKPTGIDFQAGNAGDSILFGYYPAGGDLGKLATVTRGSVTSAFAYAGRLTQSYAMNGDAFGPLAPPFVVTQTHDNDLRVTSETLNGLPSITYAYDDDGAPSSVGGLVITRDLPAPQGSGTGLPVSLTLGNVALAVTYDEIGQPTSETTSVEGALLYAESFVRDAAGRIVQRTETIAGQTTTTGYAYDLKGQLTDVSPSGAPTEHFDYDLNGNRDPAPLGPAVYDAQDRLVSYGGEPYTYTPAGELSSVGAGAQQTTYVYDDLGQLASVQAGGVTYAYVIDGLGRRVARVVDGVVERGWVYGGGAMPTAEVDGTGDVRALFAYATGGAPDVMWTFAGGVPTGTYRVVKDHLGSVRLVVDASSSGASPVVVQRIDYDAWGKVVSDSNAGFQPFGFAGGLYDADTGLVRFGARDYDAATARWTAKDPIGISGEDTNLYGYVLNDPVNLVDPTGLYGMDSTRWDSYAADVGRLSTRERALLGGIGLGATAVGLGGLAIQSSGFMIVGGTSTNWLGLVQAGSGQLIHLGRHPLPMKDLVRFLGPRLAGVLRPLPLIHLGIGKTHVPLDPAAWGRLLWDTCSKGGGK